jgi:hypothetical protein
MPLRKSFLAKILSSTPINVTPVPPVLLLLLAYAIEAYVSVLTRFPTLTGVLGLKEPRYPLSYLQPSVLRGSTHVLIDDSVARRSVAEGGIGYRGVCTSLEGFCEEMVAWNREHEGKGSEGGRGGVGVEGVGVGAKAVGG